MSSEQQGPDMSHAKLAPGPTVAHRGSCHCGAVTFTLHCPSLQDPPTQQVMACNCSQCQRAGYLLVYPPRDQVEFFYSPKKSPPSSSSFDDEKKNKKAGPTSAWCDDEGGAERYRFNTKTVSHVRCRTCGSPLGIDFHGKIFEGDRLAINIRLIDNIDVPKLKIVEVDGRNLLPSAGQDS